MLKSNVEVLRGSEATSIKYALWAVELPKAWLNEHKSINDLLVRNIDEKEINTDSLEERHIIELLRVQGCFEENEKQTYQGKEIFEMYWRVVNVWYARYYQHPIWEKIQNGCSLNIFVAWLIQNYHLSRSAGVTDSRCAIFLPYPELRDTFKQNAIEEYWHCDAFYFVNHPKLKIPRADIKNYIPLRSSIAFDQQMLQLAEKDPLAYIMVSYFQENSANFFHDCKSFYKAIEDKYGLDDFFKPWVKHLSYDFEFDHGDRYGELFLKFDNTSKEQLLYSFKNAAITVGYLFEAFDEILMQPEQESILLRMPMQENTGSSLLETLLGQDISTIELIASKDNLTICHRIVEAYYKSNLKVHVNKNQLQPFIRSSQTIAYIQEALSNAAFRGASFSYEHDEILTLGFIAQHLQKTSVSKADIPIQESEWTALINYLLEGGTKPKHLILAIYYIHELFLTAYNVCLLPKPVQKKITNFISENNGSSVNYLNFMIPLLENFTKFALCNNNFCQFNIFKD